MTREIRDRCLGELRREVLKHLDANSEVVRPLERVGYRADPAVLAKLLGHLRDRVLGDVEPVSVYALIAKRLHQKPNCASGIEHTLRRELSHDRARNAPEYSLPAPVAAAVGLTQMMLVVAFVVLLGEVRQIVGHRSRSYGRARLEHLAVRRLRESRRPSP